MKSIGLPYENEKWFRDILNNPNFVYEKYKVPKEICFATMWSNFENLYLKAINDRNRAKSNLEYYDKALNLMNKMNSLMKEFNDLHVPIYKKNPDGTKKYLEQEFEIQAQKVDYVNEVTEDRNETLEVFKKCEEVLGSLLCLKDWLQNCDILMNLYYCLSKCDTRYISKTERMIKKYSTACQTSYNILEKIDEIRKLMDSENGGIWMNIKMLTENVISKSNEMIKMSRDPKEDKFSRLWKGKNE